MCTMCSLADRLFYDKATHTVQLRRWDASNYGTSQQSLTILCQLENDPSGRVFNHSITLDLPDAPKGPKPEKASCDIIIYKNTVSLP